MFGQRSIEKQKARQLPNSQPFNKSFGYQLKKTIESHNVYCFCMNGLAGRPFQILSHSFISFASGKAILNILPPTV